jgi:hypothetical protein
MVHCSLLVTLTCRQFSQRYSLSITMKRLFRERILAGATLLFIGAPLCTEYAANSSWQALSALLLCQLHSINHDCNALSTLLFGLLMWCTYQSRWTIVHLALGGSICEVPLCAYGTPQAYTLCARARVPNAPPPPQVQRDDCLAAECSHPCVSSVSQCC